jgi:hypothetical protein
MRRPCFFALLLISLMLLSPVVVAGCRGTVTPGTTRGGPPTKASDATAAAASDATTTTAAATSTGEVTTTTTAKSAAAAPDGAGASGATPSSDATPEAPDAGTISTLPNGMPVPITPEEIKNTMLAGGMGSPDQLQIYEYKNFGHYAAAYVMAADENVYLMVFNDETGGWVILDALTGLDWEAVQVQLRATGAPEDLITWAYPGEG